MRHLCLLAALIWSTVGGVCVFRGDWKGFAGCGLFAVVYALVAVALRETDGG